MTSAKENVRINAVIHRIVFDKPGQFSVLSMKTDDQKAFYAVGTFPEVKSGQRLRLEGKWTVDSKYGKQFKVKNAKELLPETVHGLTRYLAGHFEGIGVMLAQRLVEHLGKNVLQIIENQPEKLRTVPGIGKLKQKKIIRAWKKNKKKSKTLLFLHSLKLGPAGVAKAWKKYGIKAEEIIRGNPYRLAHEIHGIGFISADQLALQLGINKNSPQRIRAGIHYEIITAMDEGHCGMFIDELIRFSTGRLNISGNSIKTEIANMIKDGALTLQRNQKGRKAVLLPGIDRLENELSKHISTLAKQKITALNTNIDTLIAKFEAATDIHLDPSQKNALNMVVKSPIMILTGGPGTGKTTLVQAILKIFKGKKIKMAAPTGRAAQRLRETSHYPASTIHRLLEFNPKTGGFNYNATHKLNADILIIDESSMLDLSLAAALFRAIPYRCRIILVGDADQLPSVGPGRVFADIIESGKINTARLKFIFRQTNQSLIVQNAHRILNGEMPKWDNESTKDDFYLIIKDDPEDIIQIIRELPHRISHRFRLKPIKDTQVLCPMYKGSIGVDNINSILKTKLNPSNQFMVCAGRKFSPGDKVMQLKNNYQLEVFNGDIGHVKTIFPEKNQLIVEYSDGERLYNENELDQLSPAFACSIHKSQGSEYPAVIIVLHTQHYIMLKRNLFYTALTRGKQIAVVVGSMKAIALAVKNTESEHRTTFLTQRLQKT